LDDVERKDLHQRNNYSLEEKLFSVRAGQTADQIPDVYERLIFTNNGGEGIVNHEKILVDAIELNGNLQRKTNLVQINNHVDNMVFMSYALLYAGACPLITTMCFLHFCLVNHCNDLCDYHGYLRPISDTRLTTQIWSKWLEIMVYFVILWNTIIMYIASSHIKLLLSTYTKELQVFIIFGIEHFLIGCVFMLKKNV